VSGVPASPRTRLIIGGQKSGKSRQAELLAREWLSAGGDHRAILIATGQACDEEMAARIARHRRERAARAPGLQTVEEPWRLAEKITELSRPGTLMVVDCLTLWLVNQLMPVEAEAGISAEECEARMTDLADAVAGAAGPVILISNEIGLGVIPLGRDVRAYVDALGLLNQRLAAVCEQVTLMSAGLPLVLKGGR